ncbi:MAG: hypothetical protein K2M73_05530 [Lachnospiraceae bacterium]|nr:hypothetical protein [Lachnospiraceae bacterium]
MDLKKIVDAIKSIGMPKILLLLGAGILLVSFEFAGNDKENSAEYGTEALNGMAVSSNTYNITSSMDFNDNEYVNSIEKKIGDMIKCIATVEDAKVFLTIKTGSRRVVLTETPYNKSDTTETDKNGGNRVVNNEDKNYNTVYITDENGNEVPYVVTVNAPEILGIAVAVTGNITASDKEDIIKTINTLTGVGINNISVIITK